jgi:M-phase inducer tyrosine phosphatase
MGLQSADEWLTGTVKPLNPAIFVVNYKMNMMDSLSSSPLAESFTIPAFPSSPPSPTGTDTDFPIEVDRSFNSSMTISDEGMSVTSPTPTGQTSLFSGKFSPVRSKISMSTDGFLSPAPAGPIFKGRPVRPVLSPIQQTRGPQHTAPAFHSTKRAFGSEWSSNAPKAPAGFLSKSKGMMAPPAIPEGKAGKSRSPLPSGWCVPKQSQENRVRMMAPSRSEVSYPIHLKGVD